MKLTERVLKFIDLYTGACAGNGAKAAEGAGYSPNGAKVTAHRLLQRADVRDAIANRLKQIEALEAVKANQRAKAAEIVERHEIADAVERRQGLSGMFRDKEMHPIARLKAADILNKMDGLYVQKHEVGGAEGGPVHVRVTVVRSGAPA